MTRRPSAVLNLPVLLVLAGAVAGLALACAGLVGVVM